MFTVFAFLYDSDRKCCVVAVVLVVTVIVVNGCVLGGPPLRGPYKQRGRELNHHRRRMKV